MTTISNIFSNLDDSNNDITTITHSLSQGKKFEKYQIIK